MSDSKVSRPLTFQIARWHSFVFAAIFMLYGGVKIILSFLDHNYNELAQPFMFALLGIILIIVAVGFSELKKWGWQALIVINSLIIFLTLFQITAIESIIILILSAVALYSLFSEDTKSYLAKGR